MPLWKIAYRSIQFRAVSSILTAFSMSLGVALIITVIVIHGVLSDSFNKSAQGYNLIIAAKGSPLDVVLSTVFYIRPPVGEVPESYMRILKSGLKREPLVTVDGDKENRDYIDDLIEEAIPISIGHHYRNAPIIGVPLEFFTKLKYMGDRSYELATSENPDDKKDFSAFDKEFSAIVGSRVGKRLGLQVGNEFLPEAAQDADCGSHEPFKIVGVLAPTGTPNDNAIFVNIDGFYDMHDHNHGQPNQSKSKRYSAILLMTVDPDSPNVGAGIHRKVLELPNKFEKTTDVQAVSPVNEIVSLLDNVIGNVQKVLILLAILVIIVAGIGMMVSIYNSMSERRQEIALMRALGARRLTVMTIILLESILLSLGGGALGLVFGHVLIGGIGPWISEYTGIVIKAWDFQVMELVLIPGLILLASVVGFLPAAVAYRQDVATSLAP